MLSSVNSTCSAGFQPAVSQIFNLQYVATKMALKIIQRLHLIPHPIPFNAAHKAPRACNESVTARVRVLVPRLVSRPVRC
jgi:hypothetical protein